MTCTSIGGGKEGKCLLSLFGNCCTGSIYHLIEHPRGISGRSKKARSRSKDHVRQVVVLWEIICSRPKEGIESTTSSLPLHLNLLLL